MKRLLKLAIALIVATGASAALAQAYPAGSTINRTLRSSVSPIGNFLVGGQLFPAALPLSPSSSNPALAVVGTFHTQTLIGSANGAGSVVCAADRAQFLADISTDTESAAEFLREFPTREALGVVQWGPSHVIVLARLRNGPTDYMMRYYPLRQLGPRSFCLTRELKSDAALLPLIGFMLNNVNGQLF